MSDATWTNYADARPPKGRARWRLPHLRLQGVFVEFDEDMRERGAGLKTVLSPRFDRWNGWDVIVPDGTQWRESPEPLGCVIDGHAPAACAACGTVPTLHGVERGSGGGCFIGACANSWNSWWLECCQWGKTPHLDDPRELIAQWNAVRAKREEARRG